MPNGGAQTRPDEAFERIEETILPTLSLTLDTLLEAAALARPGQDGEAYAAQLKSLGLQLEALTRELESLSPPRVGAASYRAASAA